MGDKSKRGNVATTLLIWGVIIWGGILLFSDSDATTSDTYDSYYNSNYDNNTLDYHYDNTYEYNYRSGSSGSYDYNYSVSGYGDSGYVYGDIDTSGKYGEGRVYDEDGNEVYIETEWTGYGTLEAYDEYGNWYELEIE